MTNIDLNVIGTEEGLSPILSLPAGKDYLLSFTSAEAFALDLKVVLGNGEDIDDVYMGDTPVQIDSTSGSLNVVVPGGRYQMDITTFNEDVTMWGIPV